MGPLATACRRNKLAGRNNGYLPASWRRRRRSLKRKEREREREEARFEWQSYLVNLNSRNLSKQQQSQKMRDDIYKSLMMAAGS
jgi:hypothetical protein